MFKALARIFGFLSKPKPGPVLGPGPKPQAPAWSPPPTQFPPASSRPIPAPAAAPMEIREEPPARPVAEEARAAAELRATIDTAASPEAICGLESGMSQAEISDILARLYQRHNRASSSFDPQLQSEAEFMLDIIAGLREKYLSRPPGE